MGETVAWEGSPRQGEYIGRERARGADNLHYFLGCDQRASSAIRFENDHDVIGRNERGEMLITGRALAATYRGTFCRVTTEHHYGNIRHRIEISEPHASKIKKAKRAGWVEIYGVAHGYVNLPMGVSVALEEAIELSRLERGSGLVHWVDPSGEILHIGSAHRRGTRLTLEG